MLDTDDATTILVELLAGKTPTITTPEADAFREKLKKDIAKITARGGQVEIPREVQA